MTLHPRRRPLRTVAIAAAAALAALITTGCNMAPEFAGYDLPPERQQYMLELDRDNIQAEWTFWSSEVTEDETPEDYNCPEKIHALWQGEEIPPCRAEPLVFVRYDADLDLDNSVPAPGARPITVTAYRQADSAPRIAGLKLWVSFDGAETWHRVPLIKRHGTDAEYRGVVVSPRYAQTDGTVSIKAEAWDVDGNRIEEQITDAWFLRDRRG